MVHEARVRMQHNKQRQKMKSILQVTSGGHAAVPTEKLIMSAKLAKLALPDELVSNSAYAKRYAGVWDKGAQSPRTIKWRQVCSDLEFPPTSDPKNFAAR